MQLSELEQIVGPINRGQLATSFISEARVLDFKDDSYLSDDDRKVKAPPLTEDFSHLNPKTSKSYQHFGRKGWTALSDAKRKKRLKDLAAAGRIGGGTNRKMVVRKG